MRVALLLLWIALSLFSGIFLSGASAGFSQSGATAEGDGLVDDTAATLHRAALGRLTTPELEARIARRSQMQREGYADILSHVLRGDGLWGVIAAARSHLQLEYSLPRIPIVIFIPVRQPERHDPRLPGFTGAPSPPIAVPLREDRTFPADPWGNRR